MDKKSIKVENIKWIPPVYLEREEAQKSLDKAFDILFDEIEARHRMEYPIRPEILKE